MKMFCFGPPRIPSGNPKGWSARSVKKFLESKDLGRHKGAFAFVNGNTLLKLNGEDLDKLSEYDDRVREAINELRIRWSYPSLKPKSPEDDPGAARDPSPAKAMPTQSGGHSESTLGSVEEENQTKNLEELQSLEDGQAKAQSQRQHGAQNGSTNKALDLDDADSRKSHKRMTDKATNGVEHILSDTRRPRDNEHRSAGSFTESAISARVQRRDSLSSWKKVRQRNNQVYQPFDADQWSLESPQRDTGHLPQGINAWARTLASYFPYGCTHDGIVLFLMRLGKDVGQGLVLATSSSNHLEQLFYAIYNLDQAALKACACRRNAQTIAELGREVLCMIDQAYLDGQHPRDEDIRDLTTRCRRVEPVILSFSRPGWLLRLICGENSKSVLDDAHEGIVQIVKGCGLDKGYDWRGLDTWGYQDVCTPLRRMISQEGCGSITRGVISLQNADLKAVWHDYSSVLQLSDGCHGGKTYSEIVKLELDAIPTEAGIDVETYFFNNLADGIDVFELGAKVFAWYDTNRDGLLDLSEFYAVLFDLGLLDMMLNLEAAVHVAFKFRAADVDNKSRLTCDKFCRAYTHLAAKNSRPRQKLRAYLGMEAEYKLQTIFYSYASLNSRLPLLGIDSAKFMKLMCDAGLVKDSVNASDAEDAFNKSKPTLERRLSFVQFLGCLHFFAESKAVPFEAIVRKVLACWDLAMAERALRPEIVHARRARNQQSAQPRMSVETLSTLATFRGPKFPKASNDHSWPEMPPSKKETTVVRGPRSLAASRGFVSSPAINFEMEDEAQRHRGRLEEERLGILKPRPWGNRTI